VRISFQLRPIHIGAAAQYIATHNASVKKQLFFGQVIAAVLAGVGVLGFAWARASGHLPWWDGVIALGAALVAYAVSAYAIRSNYVRRVVALATDNNPQFQRTVTYEIQADSLATSSELGASTVRWSAIQRIAEDTHYIYLSLPGTGTIVIPHTAFATTDQQHAFVSELRSHVAKNA